MNDLNIKEIREKLGVSQETLAEMVGVHPRTIQNYRARKFQNQNTQFCVTWY